MKRSKSSTNIWIATLSLVTLFAATSLFGHPAVAELGTVVPSSVKPINGVDVIVQCLSCKPPVYQRTKSDGDGGFTVSGLAAREYNIRFQCSACVWGDPHVDRVDIALTGASEKDFKRTVSKQQLTNGVVFAARGVGGSGGTGYLSGRVTQTVP